MKWYQTLLALLVVAFHTARVSLLLALYFVTHPFKPLTKDRPIAPGCLTDPKYGTHKYVRVNGVKLHYVEKGDSSKPLLLFVHGFPEFWYSWRYQLLEFSKDYWCVAVDQRGYSESDKPDGIEPYQVKHLAGDIRELVLALGKKKVTIVGHDWGSLVVWCFVETYGDMVDKFITLSGPSLSVMKKLVWSEWWQFWHSWYVFYFQCPVLPELTLRINDFAMFDLALRDRKKSNPSVTAEDVEAYKYVFTRKDALTAPINYYRANMLSSPPRRTTTIVPKGLYVLGEFDKYISQSTVSLSAERYKGLKTTVLKGARHFIQQENPQEVNELIRDFLK